MTLLATRRDFFATTTLGVVGRRLLHGFAKIPASFQGHPLPVRTKDFTRPASAILPERMAPTDLRALATTALEAATGAGARYADIRVAERQQLEIMTFNGELAAVRIVPQFMFGVRVLVDGAWAFAHGSTPSFDACAAAARQAVTSARGYARATASINRSTAAFGIAGANEIAPAPVATGEWTTPVRVDPFTVPIDEQLALLNACVAAANRVRGAEMDGDPQFVWTRETRVTGTTDGTLVTQTVHKTEPFVACRTRSSELVGYVALRVLRPRVGGYECVTLPGLYDEIKQTAEDIANLATVPRRIMEVGRYPAVFDGAALGAILSRTLGQGLELDRVLGYEMGAGGSSRWGPPQTMLGNAIASPVLTVTADRAPPSISAVQWDDDGVAAHSATIIRAGQLLNYFSTRQTATALSSVFSSIGAVHNTVSTACATAPEADQPVSARVPHLTVAPTSAHTTLDDLCRGMTHGLLVRGVQYCAVDHQCASGLITRPGEGVVLEVARGKVVGRVDNNALQFSTARLWKTLIALGDESTTAPSGIGLWKGEPSVLAWQSAKAPAGLFQGIDVITLR